MSVTDTTETADEKIGTGYPIVARARGQRVLLYEQYGSYQGEWLLFARDDGTGMYFIYKDWYGSCSGCDNYEGTFDYSYGGDLARSDSRVQQFIKGYPPFLEIPRETAAALATNGTLESVFPANVRDESSEADIPEFCRDASAHIKLEEALAFDMSEIWAIPNLELRRRAWEAYGVDRFVVDSGMTEIDRDGEDALVQRGSQAAYLYLKDASTPRRYLLRVPPSMQRVRQAKAWTFGLQEAEYAPSVET